MTRYFRGPHASAKPRSLAEETDQRLRTLLTREIAETAREPSLDRLGRLAHLETGAVRKALRRLEAKRGLLLHPKERRPWVVHPFALHPASCWVQGKAKGWWATCLYCAFGVSGCVGEDVVITTRLGGEAEPVEYRVQGGKLSATSDVFHFLTPPRKWWNNVLYACATFQPFHDEPEVDDWCARHGLQKGYVLTVERLFDFALDWYGPHATTWRPRTPSEMRDCFARHGLEGPFWRL
jgi:hypothetical protein